MINYDEWTDFQINKAVAEAQGLESPSMPYKNNPVIVVHKIGDGIHWDYRDYCNNPSDIHPISIENKIDRIWLGGDTWRSNCTNQRQPGEFKQFTAKGENPLRNDAIVYLKMEEAKP